MTPPRPPRGPRPTVVLCRGPTPYADAPLPAGPATPPSCGAATAARRPVVVSRRGPRYAAAVRRRHCRTTPPLPHDAPLSSYARRHRRMTPHRRFTPRPDDVPPSPYAARPPPLRALLHRRRAAPPPPHDAPLLLYAAARRRPTVAVRRTPPPPAGPATPPSCGVQRRRDVVGPRRERRCHRRMTPCCRFAPWPDDVPPSPSPYAARRPPSAGPAMPPSSYAVA
ncbi:hypothetical protein DENSPDRAFT_884136 [Dentipellis sp. KUC8613]|nr:hypothetical protein DENSPDRAFT_884136 [Dentipellis sp. KUC8613]